jgi:prevent-host-death family protein
MQNVSAHDAKARFGQLLDTARREPVVIERHGRAVAVVLSKEEYDELHDIKLRQLRMEINLRVHGDAPGVIEIVRVLHGRMEPAKRV